MIHAENGTIHISGTANELIGELILSVLLVEKSALSANDRETAFKLTADIEHVLAAAIARSDFSTDPPKFWIPPELMPHIQKDDGVTINDLLRDLKEHRDNNDK